MKPSRRDDLISLAYLLIFMINGGTIPTIDYIFQKNLDFEEEIELVL